MLIKEVYHFDDGRVGTKHYSDNNKYIRKVGTEEKYVEAVDILPYEYEETDEEIKEEGDNVTE